LRGGSGGARRVGSSGLPRLLSQQPLRPEHHDQDEVGEDDRRRPLPADAVVGYLLDAADDQAAEYRAPEVPDAAHDRRRERDQAGAEALVVANAGLVQRVDEASGAGEQAAEQEGERDRGVDVDSHQPGGLGVLRGGPHRLAEAAAPDERGQPDDQRSGHADREHVGVRHRDAEEVEQLVLGVQQVGHPLLGPTEPQQADVLEDEREADRGDQGRQFRRVA